MLKKLIKLSNHLDSLGLNKEADFLDMIIFKFAEETKEYTIQPGDSLGLIAQKHGITTKQLKEANNMDSDNIQAGKKLIIPPMSKEQQEAKNKYETEVVAATLLGEVGTTNPESMKAIMKLIKNRAAAKNVSDFDIVMEKGQFEYWTRNPSVSKVLSGDLGRNHKLWEMAFDIASGNEDLPDIGGATHYYKGATPYWADKTKNKCWVSIEHDFDPEHTYGIDKSIRAYNGGKTCDPAVGPK